MRVAVLGAGIQGACAALELARRGCAVDLYEREALPVSRASLWNEGKIHLGFIFANDAPWRTARTMLLGSLYFAGALARWGIDALDDHSSEPFTYAVPRGSMLGADRIEAHFRAVSAQYRDLRDGLAARYLGVPTGVAFERLPAAATGRLYDGARVQAAFRTIERSIDPEWLAGRLREALSGEPRIRLHAGRTVAGVALDAGGGLRVRSNDRNGEAGAAEGYDHVVNALWGDRLRVDAELGLAPRRPWLFRYKLALHVRPREPYAAPPPSTTLLLGSYGDVVNFGGRRLYLSWYPVCRLGATGDLTPPDWGAGVTDELRRQVFEATLEALGAMVPGVGGLGITYDDTAIEGGLIFNWGRTDISDPASELHQRFDIGIHSAGTYHSIDTGKYCMAPYFALRLGERIRSEG